MQESDDGIRRVCDCTPEEHEYLHRDFHGALCFAVRHLDETWGPDATAAFLRRLGTSVYAPLRRALLEEGLPALATHWRGVFAQEGGRVEIELGEEELTLRVARCPAVAHLQARGLLFTDRYCETTRQVNAGLCAGTGYRAACDYDAGAGRCVQRFWREDGA
jgi:hypothetical protein